MDDAPERPRPRPWIAAVAGLVIPGMGQVYAGRARRGLLLWMGAVTAGVLLLWISLVTTLPEVRVLAIVLLPFPWLIAAADAVRVARSPHARRPRWFVLLGVAVALVLAQSVIQLLTETHVARAFRIRGASMLPTLLRGDFVLFSPHRGGQVARGAVVAHVADGEAVVARLMGLPGDTLAMRAGRLTVNGRALREPYAIRARAGYGDDPVFFAWQRAYLPAGADTAAYHPTRGEWGPIVVPERHYFPLGDNRAEAVDGRHAGFVHEDDVAYRARWIYFSLNHPSLGVRWSRIGRAVR